MRERVCVLWLIKTRKLQILKNVGLVICVFDILDSSEGMVLHGDGRLYHKGPAPSLF